MTLVDQKARERIRYDLDTTLVVEAAAGTGKTTELVHRITSVLRSGRSTLDRMVAMTFTEKAAGEMKLRLRAELEQAKQDPDATPLERARLSDALSALETAHIATIHAFCGDVLSERPIEAGVDPGFTVTTQEEAIALQRGVFDAWFQRVLSDPPEGVRRVLARHSPTGPSPREELQSAATTLIEQRDFDTPWRRDGFDREDTLDRVVSLLNDLARACPPDARDKDAMAQCLRTIGDTCRDITIREAPFRNSNDPFRDYDTIEADLRRLLRQPVWKKTGTGKYVGEGVLRSDLVERRNRIHDTLELCMQACEADLAACLHRDLQPLVALYAETKQRAGVLDFLDLLIRVRDMLRDHEGVRRELRERFTHLFVDELQDTDPLQTEIVLTLAGDEDPTADDACSCPPGRLFVVGDPKQSIYRFRRADVSLYARVKRKLTHAGAEVLYLTTSFRSLPEIQSAVNAGFSRAMQATEDGSQPEYRALTPFRESRDSQPAVIALPVPRPYSDRGAIVGYAIEASLPSAVGAFVHWLIQDSGFTVHEPGHGDVPLEARHVCLLFRRMRSGPKDVVRPYVRALEAHRVPHVLMGGRSFHAREEVMALRAALHAIEWPDDELHVHATLRGPLFALSDEQLLITRQRFGHLHPLRRTTHENDSASDEAPALVEEVTSALAILAKLHRGRNRRPAADTLTRLLRETRAHAGFAVWPAGEQVLANVLRVLDEARRFEARGTTSFRAFVEHTQFQAGEASTGEAPVVEEATDGVRVMTVHNAKGLEFPVVVLCDPTAQRGSKFPSRHVDHARRLWVCSLAGCMPSELREQEAAILRHEDEESVRLAYVASTRARDLLVLPTVGDKAIEGWFDMLNPAVYPTRDRRRAAEPAPGCPEFGDDSVLEASFDARRDTNDSVKPGMHTPEAGTHRVTWWDPALLVLNPREPVGLRQQELLHADAESTRSHDGIAQYVMWQTDHNSLIAHGSTPTLVARTITAIAHAELDAEPSPTAPATSTVTPLSTGARSESRPGGRRFGTLVHALLAERFGTPALTFDTLAQHHARLLMATNVEVAAAIEAASRAWDHDVLVRARKSKDCRVEVPMWLRREDGTLAEGIADLAFLEATPDGPSWVVVDFKTDDPTGNVAYALQVDLYAKAIAHATGLPARAILLGV